MSCVGDGWHKAGDAKVLVRNRVIVECLMHDADGNWVPRHILRWNNKLKKFQRAGMVTLNAFRAGARRGTIAVGN